MSTITTYQPWRKEYHRYSFAAGAYSAVIVELNSDDSRGKFFWTTWSAPLHLLSSAAANDLLQAKEAAMTSLRDHANQVLALLKR